MIRFIEVTEIFNVGKIINKKTYINISQIVRVSEDGILTTQCFIRCTQSYEQLKAMIESACFQ